MICSYCGKSFEGKRSDAIYCSAKCGNNKRNSALYYRSLDAAQAKRRRLYEDNIERHMLARVKSRAKTLGVPFDLLEADLVCPSVCPVLGIPIVIQFGNGYGPKINSPSVDRIDPGLGYVRGNVRVISQRANLLKNDATVAELRAVLADLCRITNEAP